MYLISTYYCPNNVFPMLIFIGVQLLMMIFDPDVEIDQSSIEVVVTVTLRRS